MKYFNNSRRRQADHGHAALESGQATHGATSPQVFLLQVDRDDAEHRRAEQQPGTKNIKTFLPEHR